jgi:hypothetical protein
MRYCLAESAASSATRIGVKPNNATWANRIIKNDLGVFMFMVHEARRAGSALGFIVQN